MPRMSCDFIFHFRGGNSRTPPYLLPTSLVQQQLPSAVAPVMFDEKWPPGPISTFFRVYTVVEFQYTKVKNSSGSLLPKIEL